MNLYLYYNFNISPVTMRDQSRPHPHIRIASGVQDSAADLHSVDQHAQSETNASWRRPFGLSMKPNEAVRESKLTR